VTLGTILSLARATWKGEPQPPPCSARPVLLTTMTRAGIIDPAGIVFDGSTIRAHSGAFGCAEATG